MLAQAFWGKATAIFGLHVSYISHISYRKGVPMLASTKTMANKVKAMLLRQRGPRLVVSTIEHRIYILLLPQMALRKLVLVEQDL